jgi:hypothetical protein
VNPLLVAGALALIVAAAYFIDGMREVGRWWP